MKINNYGDIGAVYLKKKLIAYVQFGSYSGEYVAVFDDGEDLAFYKGNFGSCSGCDWLEAERDWDTDEVDDAKVLAFGAREFVHAFATIPKETITRVDATTFTSFLPANVRGDIYEFDGSKLHSEIIKQLTWTPNPSTA